MNNYRKKIPRRTAVKYLISSAPLLLAFNACERHRYTRPAKEISMGPVNNLLFARTHLPIKAVLVYRDANGWSVLSTRCTYDGCDLTMQEPVLLCPCCQSRFSLSGAAFRGHKASRPLPWIDIHYSDGHLYANPGVKRHPEWRFTTPEIEDAISKLSKEIKEAEDLREIVDIPDILNGSAEVESGSMFLEPGAKFQ